MKQIWFAVCLAAGSLLTPSIASADSSSEALLQEMGKASQTLNYEMGFINITKQGIDSFPIVMLSLLNFPRSTGSDGWSAP